MNEDHSPEQAMKRIVEIVAWATFVALAWTHMVAAQATAINLMRATEAFLTQTWWVIIPPTAMVVASIAAKPQAAWRALAMRREATSWAFGRGVKANYRAWVAAGHRKPSSALWAVATCPDRYRAAMAAIGRRERRREQAAARRAARYAA